MTGIPVRLQLRWGDLDAFGHVNNAAVVRLLEEARTRGLWAPDADDADEAGFPRLAADSPVWSVVADLQVTYRRQLDYEHSPITVMLTVSTVSGASCTIGYAVFADGEKDPRVTASTTIVTVDRETGRPCRLPEAMRSALEALRA
ncbi:thioesterase family protein [Nesterenkonia sp. F]|uniref:acyl-CoA thioesterase n=1 Tax=Nesterenkonia sp. F TaxID=795955 RepID=UPI000255D26F|nr:thioesterase family protein [Nesterenkonia sp. F]